MAGLGRCTCLLGSPTQVRVATAGAIDESSFQFQSGRSVYRGRLCVSPGSGGGHLYKQRTSGHHAQKRNGMKLMIASAESAKGNNDSTADKRGTKARDKVARRTSDVRGRITDFLEQKSGYSWLLGPMVSITMIVIPATTMSLANIFQRNYLAGIATTFGLDILFVISTDLFLVLTNKLGHHNKVAGGPAPWIGPWEFTGYPDGFPKLLNYVSYSSVAVAAMASIASLFSGKLFATVAVLAPYLALIFVQVAYERLMTSEKSPVTPLVPIIYTVYRIRQLSRGLLLIPTLDGGVMLSRFLNICSSLWALYLAMYLTQLPWLYSTWNSNRAT